MSDTKGWLQKLVKDFGQLSDEMPSPADTVIKLDSPSFNWSTGCGGLPVGRSICFFGGENSGKSLLMQLVFAAIQREDPDAICVLFDTEYSHSSKWFKQLGGDPKRLIVRQTNDPVKIFDYILGEMQEALQDGAPIRAIGIDSVKNIAYPKDIKEVTTNLTMGGGGASYLGPTLKRILPVIREHSITTLLVQQVYEELDAMKAMRNPYKVPDGRALKHFCDLMIQVDRLDTKKGVIEGGDNMVGGKQQVGHKIRLKNRKNRTGIPYRVAEFSLHYERGIIDQHDEIVDLAVSLGVVYHPVGDSGKVNNQMWQFGKHPPVRGEENVRRWVKDNRSVYDEIVKACDAVSDTAILNARNETYTVVDVDVASVEVDADDI
jgi:recombination protein RecA